MFSQYYIKKCSYKGCFGQIFFLISRKRKCPYNFDYFRVTKDKFLKITIDKNSIRLTPLTERFKNCKQKKINSMRANLGKNIMKETIIIYSRHVNNI